MLLATASRYKLKSTFASSLLHHQDPLTITIQPQDADRVGLTAGSAVDVCNERGSVTATLQIERAARPGVALMSKGHWSIGADTVNAVTAERDADTGGGATYHDYLVTIRRVHRTVDRRPSEESPQQ